MSASAAEKIIQVEAEVPPYELPDVLTTSDGKKIATAGEWNEWRPRLLRIFEEQVYGVSPALPPVVSKVREEATPAFSGKALRKQVRVAFTADPDGPGMNLLMYTPAEAKSPVPVFLGLNFKGNHAVTFDPGVFLAECWLSDPRDGTVKDNKATEAGRGAEARRWPIEWILSQGFGVVTACYNDIDPDYHDDFKNGVHALFPEIEKARDGKSWGTIAAWAWGLRVAMNYLETDASVDAKRVAVHGHSRLGKTALWAGATDERFALVISNESGCGGAALSKRLFGETVGRINQAFPHWFCGNFKQYSENETALPVDQHQLLALIAPRPLLVGSAEEDLWADPKGERLSQEHAAPVYHLLEPAGKTDGLHPKQRYFIRPGKHDVMKSDWEAWVELAKSVWKL